MVTSKNMFGRAFDGLFGPSSPLTNEPTIDYNNTIHSFRSQNTSYPRSPASSTNQYPTANYWEDSDEELNNDMSAVYNQLSENSTHISEYLHQASEIPGNFSTYSNEPVPNNAQMSFGPMTSRFENIGKDIVGDRFERIPKSSIFRSSSPNITRHKPSSLDTGLDARYNARRNGRTSTPTHYRSQRDLSVSRDELSTLDRFNSRGPKNDYQSEANIRPNSFKTRKPDENIGTSYSAYDKPFSSYESGDRFNRPRVDNLRDSISRFAKKDFKIFNDSKQEQAKELLKLEQEINQESLTKLNTKFNHTNIKLDQFKTLKSLNDQIVENNRVLSKFDELLKINNDPELRIPDKDNERYNNLRSEYLSELTNHQVFYQNYLKLFQKYKNLKSDKYAKVIAKLELIRDTTEENSIKLICTNLLNDFSKK
ncbi:hypothetical protein CANTEDRAFT_133175 [Yamadazyma tenuis ATCC 10573]|uniref:Uncharacterized protein n=1 Tax=Candida tenuis (strain ATCC 10573 / BCRC 21748 / CBS 615 / JCM 9827 / NBRC 10315 / NRRL Y-1498 / VKM Y-70) TaxID=590646 RepID=G3AY40_CANTC|nr:uncharacterized protein CANTEDRAFT_133175 [Yamadazyma tenuis ATCC 10573]EGV65762.1 hypothetical protein CANTEDRAFT_133175 [Yamadazyma tenuis ATCC 10573]